jgi:hypothetical protein
MGPKGIKLYPLDRFCLVRDGNGRPTEVVTVESVDRQFLPEELQEDYKKRTNHTGENTPTVSVDVTVGEDEVAVYTHAKLIDGQWRWRQEANGEVIPGSEGRSPKDKTPGCPCASTWSTERTTAVAALRSTLVTYVPLKA